MNLPTAPPTNRIRNLTLRQLQIFSVAAQHLSFARAAEELHLTQPAVWMQVKQLDELVGLPLFEKIGRKMFLTDAGNAMRETASAIFGEIRRSEERIASLQGGSGGAIVVAVVSTGKYFVPRLLGMFNERHPGVTVQLVVANRDQLVQMLQRNEVDICVMGRPPHEIETRAEAFAPHPHVVIAAPGHPLSRERRVSAQRAAQEVFLLRETGSGSRTVMESYFAEHRIELRKGMVMGSNETIKQGVIANMGLAFISLHTLSLELRTNELALIDVEDTPVMREWYTVHLSSKTLSPAAEAFRAFMGSQASDHLASTFDRFITRPT